MEQPIDKFQRLLRDIFQFDCADLDFGIYRIMNHKRDVIEKFLRFRQWGGARRFSRPLGRVQ